MNQFGRTFQTNDCEERAEYLNRAKTQLKVVNDTVREANSQKDDSGEDK